MLESFDIAVCLACFLEMDEEQRFRDFVAVRFDLVTARRFHPAHSHSYLYL